MSESSAFPYPYPVRNSDLIKHHKLEKHFEGGYFAQTVSLPSHAPATPTWPSTLPQSPALQAKGREQAPWGPGSVLLGGPAEQVALKGEEDPQIDATIIYYLLTPDSYRGRMHMNLHSVGRCVLFTCPSREGTSTDGIALSSASRRKGAVHPDPSASTRGRRALGAPCDTRSKRVGRGGHPAVRPRGMVEGVRDPRGRSVVAGQRERRGGDEGAYWVFDQRGGRTGLAA